MSESRTIEYALQPLVGSVEVRRTGPDNVFITVRPKLGRILVDLAMALVAIAGGMLLFYLPNHGHSSIGFYILPIFIIVAGCIGGIASALRHMHPTTFEATSESLIISWRTFTEIKRLTYPRIDLQDLRADRIRCKDQWFKRWFLVLRLKNGTEVTIFRASRAELACMARHLSDALLLREPCQEAMRIPAPPGCRYLRRNWGDGVAIFIPPRGERLQYTALAIFSVLIAIACCICIRLITPDETYYSGIWGQWFAAAALSLIAGVSTFAMLYRFLRHTRRHSVIVVSPQAIEATESGFLHPLNVKWNSADVQEVAAAGGKGGPCLRITPAGGQPLELAVGERQQFLEWAAAVINAARISAQHPVDATAPGII